MVLRARHRDVEQAPLLLDLLARPGAHVRRNAAVDDVEDVHRLPFLALRGVNRRQDQVVVVEPGRAGLGARRRRAGPASPRSGSARASDRSPRSAAAARDRPAARARPRRSARGAARTSARRGPSRRATARSRRAAARTGATSARQSSAAGGGRVERVHARPSGPAAPSIASSSRAAVAGPTPGSRRAARKPAIRLRGFSAQRRMDSTSLTCAASRNLSPPNFTNGMSRRASSSSSCALWLDAAEEHRLRLERDPVSRGMSSTRSAT